MDQIQEFVDKRQKGFCIHCGTFIDRAEATRDHVPSKCLLTMPYPENLPVVYVCGRCNKGFSKDEEYLAAFLGCVLAGSSDPDKQVIAAARRILERNNQLQQRIETSKEEITTTDGNTRYFWRPEIDRIKRVLVKNARGHAFYEYGEPMLDDPAEVWYAPLECLTASKRAEFEGLTSENAPSVLPEVGSRMMTRIATGQDMVDSWISVQHPVYRYAVERRGRMLVKTVLFEYLATEVYWED